MTNLTSSALLSVALIIVGVILLLLAGVTINGNISIFIRNRAFSLFIGGIGLILFSLGLWGVIREMFITQTQQTVLPVATTTITFTNESQSTDRPTDVASTSTLQASEWHIFPSWPNHTEFRSCPGYPSVQEFSSSAPGLIELTSPIALQDGNQKKWCFTVRFTKQDWWVDFYRSNSPTFETTDPESLALYFRDLPDTMRVEVEGHGQLLPGEPWQNGISLLESPATFYVFAPLQIESYQIEFGPYLPGEPAVVIP